MEHHDTVRITAMKVRKICCEEYQKKLQEKLLRHEGVCSVEINPYKSLVKVRGKVDSDILLNIVARIERHAKIVCDNKIPSHGKCCKYSRRKCTNSCCHDHNKSHKIQEEHKCEDYVPPPFFDQGMFRDYSHRPRSWRPATGFSSHFIGHPPRHGGGPFWHDLPPPLAGYGPRRRHSPGFYGYGGYFH